jgi:hypothetical protein
MSTIVSIIENDIPNVPTNRKTGPINGFVFYTFKHTFLEEKQDFMDVQINNYL